MKIPDEVTRVEGCTCGGTIYHRVSEPPCEFLDQDQETAQAALDDAERRTQAYIDEKNRELHQGRLP